MNSLPFFHHVVIRPGAKLRLARRIAPSGLEN
jgi:hypothetical protein